MKEPQISAELWISNLLEAARLISDREFQERRWLASDAQAWETPEEAICSVEDCILDGFIEQFMESFSSEQSRAVTEFRDVLERYCKVTPRHLDPAEVLTDPAWENVRNKAAAFIQAFNGSWPADLV